MPYIIQTLLEEQARLQASKRIYERIYRDSASEEDKEDTLMVIRGIDRNLKVIDIVFESTKDLVAAYKR